MKTFDNLQAIFRDVFDDETLVINASTSAKDIEDWDSFAQINIVVAIEEEWGVKFTLEEITDLKNVGEMYELIGRKTNE